MAVLLKAIYTFNAILSKIPMSISVEKKKLILNTNENIKVPQQQKHKEVS
jgi:hypothetical protein